MPLHQRSKRALPTSPSQTFPRSSLRMTKLQNVLIAVLVSPFVLVAGLIWWVLGLLLTKSLVSVATIFYLGFVGVYTLYLTHEHQAHLIHWPIVLFLGTGAMLLSRRNSIVFNGLASVLVVYAILVRVLLPDNGVSSYLNGMTIVSCLLPVILVLNYRSVWIPVSIQKHEQVERRLYHQHISTPHKVTKVAGLGTVHVPYTGKHTCSRDSRPQTLVLVHGFGAGNGFWAANLQELAHYYDVYAVEWIGVGRSDRPKFQAKTHSEAEDFFFHTFDEWRRQVGLNRFILAGHSLGAMLVTGYALRHAHCISHLLLISPVGVPERAANDGNVPVILKLIRAGWNSGLTPMSVVRFAGPFGPQLLQWLLAKRISWLPENSALRTGEVSVDDICEYTYHNWGNTASGEKFLHSHLHPGAWGKMPLSQLLAPGALPIPITFIYGGPHDWMDSSHGQEIVNKLESSQYCRIRRVPHAGHQVFLDNARGFNQHVIEAIQELEDNVASMFKQDEKPSATSNAFEGTESSL